MIGPGPAWWVIAVKEVADGLRGGRTLLCALACTVLMLTSFALLAEDFAQRQAGYDRRDTLGQTRAGKRPKLACPPSNLSVLARGLDQHNGRQLLITWSQPRRQPGAAVLDQGDQNPLLSLFRALDLVRVTQFTLSLLALFMAHDAICGEARRGTLGLVLVAPVSRASLLAGKYVGQMLGLLCCLLPGLLATAAAMALSDGVAMRGEDWLRAAGIAGLTLVYVSLFLNMGIWASALSPAPRTSLLLLLCIWTVWLVGVPSLSVPLGRWLQPHQAVEELERAKSELRGDAYDSYIDYANACWAMDDRFVAEVDRQIDFTASLSRLSPMASYTYGASALARTGIDDARRFRDAVIHWDRGQRRLGYNWQDEIPFAHEPPRLAWSCERTLADLALLLLWNVGFVVAGAVALARRDVSR